MVPDECKESDAHSPAPVKKPSLMINVSAVYRFFSNVFSRKHTRICYRCGTRYSFDDAKCPNCSHLG